MGYTNFRLTVIKGFNKGEVFPLEEDEVIIGRGEENGIVLNIAEISRKHSVLTRGEEGYIIKDLGSTNGTYVNGQRLMGPHVPRPGELVKLGENVSLAFEAGYDPDATMVASPSQFEPATFQPPPKESYVPAAQPQPVPQPPPQPAYSEPVPATTAQPYTSPEEGKSNRTWLYAGCGCLVVVLCVAVAGAYLFDYLNMYCTPPFNVLFTCP